VKDITFHSNNFYKWFPNKRKGIEDENKLLGLKIEKEGVAMIALGPKCYYLKTDDKKEVAKLKGVSQKQNEGILSYENYKKVAEEKIIIKASNKGFRLMKNPDTNEHRYVKYEVEKNALTPNHNKMVVLPNQSCAPYIEGLDPKTDYVVLEDKSY
jgi:hypothetical protein